MALSNGRPSGVGCNVDPEMSRKPVALARGFTIIDLLVTMAVIAVLISILSPSLSGVRESARQVVCRSNVRQVGLGLWMYAREHSELLPSSVNAPGLLNSNPWQTITLRLSPPPAGTDGWDGLGRLYVEGYLPAPKLFYCPSHSGTNPYSSFERRWGGETGEINCNYQFRASGPTRVVSTIGAVPVRMTQRLDSIASTAAIVADGMRTQSDFNHEIGANVLRASGAVTWYTDRGRAFVDLLPKDGQPGGASDPNEAWHQLDLDLR
jgi:type II secretory pathway pseudopilin PulG